MATDPSGEIVCAGAMDPFDIYVWSLQTGKILDILSGHSGPISQLAFNPQGAATMASSSWDGTVKLWDVFKKNTPQESLIHQTDVTCLAFRPDGKMICTGSINGVLSFWNLEDASIAYTIEGQNDIAGGRKDNDRMTANNNAASRYFTSVCYSADGSCVLAGGNSKFVCIYDVAHQALLKKFQVTHNRSFDGVLDELNSKNVGDDGMVISNGGSDDEAQFNNYNLPGAKRNDDGSRKSKVEVLTSCVSFSPTGREWAAVSNEGLHIYSLDDDMVFDPIALTEAVTPKAVLDALRMKQHGNALIMSLHLNEVSLVQEALESIPPKTIALVAKSISPNYLEKLLYYMSKFMAESPHIEYYLEWCVQLLSSHSQYLTKNHTHFMRSFRSLFRTVKTHNDDLVKVCDENKYMLEFIMEQSLMNNDSKT